MPKSRLDPAKKEAILNAAIDARKSGQPWRLALVAAKQAGYKGSLAGIVQLVRNSKRLGRKRGRKAGKSKASAVAAKLMPANAGDVVSLMEKLVATRVNAAIERAVAVLRDAIAK